MYSRRSGRSPIPAHMPEHYSGWAFRPSDGPKPPEPPEKPHRENDRKDPPGPPRGPLPPPFLPPPRKEPPEGPAEQGERLPPPFPPALKNLFGRNDWLRTSGLGFDEMLLIGLILLLGGNGEDNELPLLLALLLLCG